MKVILYMAVTANGMIARWDDTVDFVSDTEWQSFVTMCNKTKNVIIGKRTYDIMENEDSFEGLDNISIIVLSHKPLESNNRENVRFTNKSPSEILHDLEKEGVTDVCICGGSKINTSFLKENLIDEIYLDVMPHIIGKGIPLFSETDIEASLELVSTKKLSEHELQLHYRVKK